MKETAFQAYSWICPFSCFECKLNTTERHHAEPVVLITFKQEEIRKTATLLDFKRGRGRRLRQVEKARRDGKA
jgi:hypothetical protein